MRPISRLNPTDEMLYGSGSKLGSARIIQVLWRLPAEVSPAALQREWDRLNAGALSRRVASARVPGARRRWVRSSNAEPPHVRTESLSETATMDWIDEQVRAPLPAGSDALWRLAAAPCSGGGLISLTVPHFRSDGMGLFQALASRSEPHRTAAPGDLGDALRQLAAASAGAARLLADGDGRSRALAAMRARPAAGGAASEPRFFTTTVLEVDAASWEECAADRGGTPNSLFLEIAANLVRARGVAADRPEIEVGIPMSLRRPSGDHRANALVVVPLRMPAGEPRHGDLRRTRQAAKHLLQGSGEQSATLVPEPLWHLLPQRYADRLKAPGAQQTDVVASNFGRVPEAVTDIAGQRAEGVALRTMNVPGVVPEKARLRASLCLLQTADRLTVTVTGMPDQFGDAGSLHGLILDELGAWGLRARHWYREREWERP